MEEEPVAPAPKTESLNVLCVICNEFFNANDQIYTTSSCGHVFHKVCITRWLNRSSSCPQCRAICHRGRVHRIYLNFAEPTEVEEVERLQIQWIPMDCSDSNAPGELAGTVQSGTDHEGFDTYVARGYFNEDLLPANYVPQKSVVYTPWGCSAHSLHTDVDLLVLTDCEVKWEPASDGFVPPNALETGYSETGEVLYTGRAIYEGRTLLGKVHPSHHRLYMPYNGQEVNSVTYEVLVVTPKDPADR